MSWNYRLFDEWHCIMNSMEGTDLIIHVVSYSFYWSLLDEMNIHLHDLLSWIWQASGLMVLSCKCQYGEWCAHCVTWISSLVSIHRIQFWVCMCSVVHCFVGLLHLSSDVFMVAHLLEKAKFFFSVHLPAQHLSFWPVGSSVAVSTILSWFVPVRLFCSHTTENLHERISFCIT
jgi:hypothetical protein